jgi:hypothetical protein
VLGFRPLVDGLHALLNDEHTTLPLALAVTAPWGAGKSSLMRQLEERLKTPAPGTRRRWYTVRFDAWKYEKSERMWAALAKAIYDDSQRAMSRRQRAWFRVRLEKERQGLRRYCAKTLVPAFGAGGAVAVAVTPLVPTAAGAPLAIGSVTAALAAVGRWWGVLGDPFKRSINDYASRPRFEEQLGFTPDAEHEIRSLIRVLGCEQEGDGGRGPGPEPALAVFLDDLDRCSAKHVVEVVEAINQIFNISEGRRCVFILGMDRDIVAASIDVAYRDTISFLEARGSALAAGFGFQFLSKIVQMSVTIPEPTEPAMTRLLAQITGNPDLRADGAGYTTDPRDVEEFREAIREAAPENPIDVEAITEEIEAERELDDARRRALAEARRLERAELFTTDSDDVAAAEFEVLAGLGRNPRHVKRFDNAFRLQLHVANGTPGCALDFGRDQLTALGRWVALRMLSPDLAHAVALEPALMAALEHEANGGPRSRKKVDAELRARYERWFADTRVRTLLREPNAKRRISALPLDTLLQVV